MEQEVELVEDWWDRNPITGFRHLRTYYSHPSVGVSYIITNYMDKRRKPGKKNWDDPTLKEKEWE